MKKIHFLAVITLSFLLCNCSTRSTSSDADFEKLQTDRWIEIDLSFFDKDSITFSVEKLYKQYHPLYDSISGTRGLIFNPGWVSEWIRNWNGDMNASINLPYDMCREPIFDQQEKLTGRWDTQKEAWRKRYAESKEPTPRYLQDWSYADLKVLVSELHRVAKEDYGYDDMKIGVFFTGWGWQKPFFVKHPEIGERINPDFVSFNVKARLTADSAKYAAYPDGIDEGTLYTDFLSAQWGLVSKNIGLDALMFRDGVLDPVLNRRYGHWGLTGPATPEEATEWSEALAYFVKQMKLANPDALIIGYSSSASAVSTWQTLCLDLEKVAKEGYLDGWIDQTWPGAWNEVGNRIALFWNQPYLGYTYQLTNVLLHAAILAETKVKHYVITETWDTWESWDAFHTVPDRSRWIQWAFWHSAVKMPGNKLKLIDGNYIAHATNQSLDMWSDEDVRWLCATLNGAIKDAYEMKEVNGPTLVYNRYAMEWLANSAPSVDLKEWIDEQAGSVMKFGVPISSVTRVEYLPEVNSDLFVLQTPNYLPDHIEKFVMDQIKEGKAYSLWGSPDKGVSNSLLDMVGVSEGHGQAATYTTKAQKTVNNEFTEDVPDEFSIFHYPLNSSVIRKDVNVLYSVNNSPALIVDQKNGRNVSFWDPADYYHDHYPKHDDLPMIERLGSAYPYVLTSRVLNAQLKANNSIHTKEIKADKPFSYLSWEMKDGTRKIMAAQMEEGMIDAIDYSTSATIVFPDSWSKNKNIRISSLWNGVVSNEQNTIQINLKEAESGLFVIHAD